MTEDWSPRKFYRTMQTFWGLDRDERFMTMVDDRKLSKKQYLACAEHYANARCKEYLNKLLAKQHGTPLQGPSPERWPDVEALGVPRENFWEYDIPLGQLYFSQTKSQQAHARMNVSKLAQKGPLAARKAIAKAIRKTLQAKKLLSGLELFHLYRLRANRQFLWRFLRFESGWDQRQLKKVLARSQHLNNIAKNLADSYPYLNLDATQIAEGLRYSHQADKDAAEAFGIKESTVRSLISKSLRC